MAGGLGAGHIKLDAFADMIRITKPGNSHGSKVSNIENSYFSSMMLSCIIIVISERTARIVVKLDELYQYYTVLVIVITMAQSKIFLYTQRMRNAQAITICT